MYVEDLVAVISAFKSILVRWQKGNTSQHTRLFLIGSRDALGILQTRILPVSERLLAIVTYGNVLPVN